MSNSKNSQKKSTNPQGKQPLTKPNVQAKPKEKLPVPKPIVAPKPNPHFPSTTGKPSGKGRGNNPPTKKMTDEAAKRIKEAEERKKTKSEDGFAERAKKAAEKNKKK